MRFARAVLLLLLVFVAFEALRDLLPWTDEIVLVLLFPVALYRRRSMRGFDGEAVLAIAAGVFGVVAIVSAVANRVPPLTAALGTFDYMKPAMLFWVFATLCGDRAWLDRAYRVLLPVALLACLWGLGQELVAQVSREGMLRLGIYRVPSFVGHPNALGMYALIFFLIESARTTRPRARIALLYAGILLSVSRMVHAAVVVLTLPLLRRRCRWLAPATAASLVFTILMFPESRAEIPPDEEGVTGVATMVEPVPEYEIGHRYRSYGMRKAVEVWRDHPAFGAGPGRFGGVISVVTKSPLYDRYGFHEKWKKYLHRLRSLDQFPPQLLAETGVAGTLAFVLLYVTILRAASLARRQDERTGNGLLLALLVIPFYTLGAGLNVAPFLPTVAGLAGAFVGGAVVGGARHKVIDL